MYWVAHKPKKLIVRLSQTYLRSGAFPLVVSLSTIEVSGHLNAVKNVLVAVLFLFVLSVN